MTTQNVIYTYIQNYLAIKRNEIWSYYNMMHTENMPSEISQTQKVKYVTRLYEVPIKGKFTETGNRIDVSRGCEWGNWELFFFFNWIWSACVDGEKVLGVDSGDGYTTL